MYIYTHIVHIHLDKCNSLRVQVFASGAWVSFVAVELPVSLTLSVYFFFLGGFSGSWMVPPFCRAFNFETRMILVLRMEISLYAKVVNQELLLDVARISKSGKDAFDPEGDLEIRSMATLTLSLWIQRPPIFSRPCWDYFRLWHEVSLAFFFRQAMQIGEQIKRSVNKRHSKASYFNSIFVAHQLDLVQWRGSIQVARYKRLEIEIDGVFAATSGKKLLRAAISLFHSEGPHWRNARCGWCFSRRRNMLRWRREPWMTKVLGPQKLHRNTCDAQVVDWQNQQFEAEIKGGGRLRSMHCAFRQHHGVHLADLKAWDNSWGLDIVRRDWCGLAKDMGEANVRGCLLLCQSRSTVYHVLFSQSKLSSTSMIDANLRWLNNNYILIL